MWQCSDSRKSQGTLQSPVAQSAAHTSQGTSEDKGTESQAEKEQQTSRRGSQLTQEEVLGPIRSPQGANTTAEGLCGPWALLAPVLRQGSWWPVC